MPASVKKIGKKYRVVEHDGKTVRNKAGTPVDGGGHNSRSQAIKQAQAIDIDQRKKK